jgi:hypothetical protein
MSADKIAELGRLVLGWPTSHEVSIYAIALVCVTFIVGLLAIFADSPRIFIACEFVVAGGMIVFMFSVV